MCFLKKILTLFLTGSAFATTIPIYIGSYSTPFGAQGKGIYLIKLDTQTGKLESADPYVVYPNEAGDNPSYMVINNNYMYVVEENPIGSVVGYKILPNLNLEKINSEIISGAYPAYITYYSGSLIIADYGDGKSSTAGVVVVPVGVNGVISKETQHIAYDGHGKDLDRQSASHTHSTYVIDGENGQKLVFVVDLGLDKIFVYNLDIKTHKLLLKYTNDVVDPKNTNVATGPRHLAFSKDNNFVYVANELSSDIIMYKLNKLTGQLTFTQKIMSYEGKLKDVRNYPSAIAVSFDGKYLYISNRGQNTIAQFIIDTNGQLKYTKEFDTHGNYPRDFSIDHTGNYLVVGNQKSDNMVLFKINKNTGALEDPQMKHIPTPVVLKFVDPVVTMKK